MAFKHLRLDLLTRKRPQLDVKAMLKEFVKTVRPVLGVLGVGTELRYKQSAEGLTLTLGEHRILVRTLGHSYWGKEGGDDAPAENDIWEYGPRAAWMEEDEIEGAEGLEDAILETKGAIIIESPDCSDPPKLAPVLGHVAAAAMSDAVAMIAPNSGQITPVTKELHKRLRNCKDVMDLLSTIWRIEVVPIEGDSMMVRIVGSPSRQFWYIVYGMHVLNLPDLGMKFHMEEGDEEAYSNTQAVVQSFSSYMVNRRAAVPVGDTASMGDGVTYRVAKGTFPPYKESPCGLIELVPA